MVALTYYETEKALSQYLCFHYGSQQDICPFSFFPKDLLDFAVRVVTESLDAKILPFGAKGLDLGCAVGRSSFELSRYCEQVLAIDQSANFISAARQLQQNGHMKYILFEEGMVPVERLAKIPKGVDPKRVEFRCCDVKELFEQTHSFDVVLAANLLCRLVDPKTFLKFLYKIVRSRGQLILASPYSWLEEYTPRVNWLGREKKKSQLDCIREILNEHFVFQRSFDLPFLIRAHLRKYECGVSQVSIWIKK